MAARVQLEKKFWFWLFDKHHKKKHIHVPPYAWKANRIVVLFSCMFTTLQNAHQDENQETPIRVKECCGNPKEQPLGFCREPTHWAMNMEPLDFLLPSCKFFPYKNVQPPCGAIKVSRLGLPTTLDSAFVA